MQTGSNSFSISSTLTRGKNERTTGQQMDMEVENRLASIRVRIDHDAIAVLREPALPTDLASREEQVAERLFVFESRLIQRVDMVARNKQHMCRRLRAEIVECDAYVVFENQRRLNLACGYFAENAIVDFHIQLLN